MKKALLLINPISGTISKSGLADRVTSRLTGLYEITPVTTAYAGHAAELARHAVAKGYDAVLVAGGDGSVNEVGKALIGSPVSMGILPYGSGNGLARHVYGSIDVDNALDIIARDCIEACDYGSANGHPFFCTFGLGFDAQVSKEFSSMARRGLPSYIRSAIREYLTYSPVKYEIRSGEQTMVVKAFIVAVCNASQYGNNAFIAPGASIRDGLLDITIIHKGNPITRAVAGVELFTGRLNRNVLIQTMRVREASIRRLPGPAHIDGDPTMMPQTVVVACHPGELRLFINPDKPKFRPFLTPIEGLGSDTSFLIKERLKESLNYLKSLLVGKK